jgi:hypothetical protein
MSRTAAEARSIVEACLYAPKGHRSAFGSGPQLGYAAIPQAEVCKVLNEQTLLMAMIETPEAVENADAIAAVDGIDVLHIGASDLSTEMGIPGQYTHERMRAAFETVARAAKGHGKAIGGRRRAPGFRVPELAVAARRALPDRRLRCRLHPQRRPRRREAVARAEIIESPNKPPRLSSWSRGSLSVSADYIGPHKIMWATDYPHSDGSFRSFGEVASSGAGPADRTGSRYASAR